MRIVEKAKATAPLAKYMTGVKEEPVIVTRNGKPIAALVSIENADLETVTLSTNRKFLALIERSRARHRTEGGISSDEMRRRLGVKRNKSWVFIDACLRVEVDDRRPRTKAR